MIWTCDRCGTTVELPDRIVIVPDWSPSAVRYGGSPPGWDSLHSEGWEHIADDETVTDACPDWPNGLGAGRQAAQGD
jgi:hypothetical protein